MLMQNFGATEKSIKVNSKVAYIENYVSLEYIDYRSQQIVYCIVVLDCLSALDPNKVII